MAEKTLYDAVDVEVELSVLVALGAVGDDVTVSAARANKGRSKTRSRMVKDRDDDSIDIVKSRCKTSSLDARISCKERRCSATVVFLEGGNANPLSACLNSATMIPSILTSKGVTTFTPNLKRCRCNRW